MPAIGVGIGIPFSNKGSTGQTTYNSFNGTDDEARLVVADFLSAKTSGSIKAYIKVVDDENNIYFSSADEGGTARYLYCEILDKSLLVSNNRKIRLNVRTNLGSKSLTSNNALSEGWHTVEVISDGSNYTVKVDDISIPFTMAGTDPGDDGKWFSSVTSRDNVTIGTWHRSSVAYSKLNCAWVKIDDGVSADWLCDNALTINDSSGNNYDLTITGSGAKIDNF